MWQELKILAYTMLSSALIFSGCNTDSGETSPLNLLMALSNQYSALGVYDDTFNSGGTGPNGNISDIDILQDGKILICGSFTTYNASEVPDSIIRLNADGTVDATFNTGGSGADGSVRCIRRQPDGQILISGDIEMYDGLNSPDHIMRLNPDGTVDSTFNNGGSGASDFVFSTALQKDGKILIAGSFTYYNGTNVPDHIIRLNIDGSVDSSFNSGGSGANDRVDVVKVQKDGKILISGFFTEYNGTDAPDSILRLNADGTVDPTFNNGGSGADDLVRAIAIQTDGKIIIGGMFTTYNGSDVPDGIIRLNTDGSVDTTFNTGESGLSLYPNNITLLRNGKILIVGNFTDYNGVNVPNSITRLMPDGTADTTFNTGGYGADSYINVAAIQKDGMIIIGGNFTEYNMQNVTDHLIRLK